MSVTAPNPSDNPICSALGALFEITAVRVTTRETYRMYVVVENSEPASLWQVAREVEGQIAEHSALLSIKALHDEALILKKPEAGL
jgi:hypothetical protein